MKARRSIRTTFPLRFARSRTRDLLALVAARQGTSMNRLAEDMIERELEVLALGLEVNLTQTVELLRAYRGEGQRQAWSQFADAEGLPEPLPTRRVATEPDPFGIAKAFAAEA